MRRRDFLAGVALVATLQPANAQQPNRVYRIGYLGVNPTTTRSQAEIWEAFDEGLRAHGLVEGVNVILRRLFSEGREDRQPGFVADLIEWKADVIVCGSKLSGTNRAKTHPSGAGFCFLVGADKEAASLIVASDAGLFVHVHLRHPWFASHGRHGERMRHRLSI